MSMRMMRAEVMTFLMRAGVSSNMLFKWRKPCASMFRFVSAEHPGAFFELCASGVLRDHELIVALQTVHPARAAHCVDVLIGQAAARVNCLAEHDPEMDELFESIGRLCSARQMLAQCDPESATWS